MTQPLGYTYKADLLCPACTVMTLTKDAFPFGMADKVNVEAFLTVIAAASGIDRTAEETFDSGDFPKTVFGHQLDSEFDQCGQCGRTLNA